MSELPAGSPQVAGEKSALRRALRAARQALPPAERMRAAEAIVAPLLAHSLFNQPGYVAGYWAMGGELPLHVLQMRLAPGQVWCLPCIQPDNSLRFAPWRPGDRLVSNQFGIPEPDLSADAQLPAEAMAVIVLPLVGFTRDGARLGMGGGYYDRTLGFRRNQPAPPLLLGAGYSVQEVPALPLQAWDVRLDAVVTEAGFWICPARGGQ